MQVEKFILPWYVNQSPELFARVLNNYKYNGFMVENGITSKKSDQFLEFLFFYNLITLVWNSSLILIQTRNQKLTL